MSRKRKQTECVLRAFSLLRRVRELLSSDEAQLESVFIDFEYLVRATEDASDISQLLEDLERSTEQRFYMN